MSSHAVKNISGNLPSATVHNDTLILHFETAETPSVSRLDLDTLAQATFEVQQQDGAYYLRLHDATGPGQSFGKFVTKADAHQALHAILQALLSHQSADKAGKCCDMKKKKCSWLHCAGKIVLWLLAAFVVFYLGLINGAQVERTLNAPKTAAVAPAASVSDAAPTAPAADKMVAPDGEAVDAEALLGAISDDSAANEVSGEAPNETSATTP